MHPVDNIEQGETEREEVPGIWYQIFWNIRRNLEYSGILYQLFWNILVFGIRNPRIFYSDISGIFWYFETIILELSNISGIF